MLDSAKINKMTITANKQKVTSNEQKVTSNWRILQLADINEIIHYLKSQYSDDKNKRYYFGSQKGEY